VVDSNLSNTPSAIKELFIKAETILKQRGCKEVHSMAQLGNKIAEQTRTDLGFRHGKAYQWYWKEII
jgi:hypothetical protein